MLRDRQRGGLRDLLRLPLGRPGTAARRAQRLDRRRSTRSATRSASTSPVYIAVLTTYMKGIVPRTSTSATATSRTPTSRTLIFDRLPATVLLVSGRGRALAGDGRSRSGSSRRSGAARCSTGRRWSPRLAFISAPVFWLGLVALYLFAQDVGVFPIFPGIGSYASADDVRRQKCGSMILPWFVLAAASAAIYARYLRSSMIDVMSEDYIRTARAKGLPERTGDHAPRRPQRDHPDRHPARPRHRRAAGRQRDPHRDGVQHPRRRPAGLHRDPDAPTCR